MKLLRLMAVAAIAIVSIPAPSFAIGTIVFDPTAVEQLLKEVGVEGQQLGQLVQTYTEVVQVYNQATNIWNSVAEVVGADGWAGGLKDPDNRNPLPFDATDYPGWVGGLNDPSSLPFGSQFLKNNTVGGDPSVYNDSNFVGSEILKAIRSLSSMQAVSTNHLSAIETRIAALGELFSHLASIGTVQETDSLSARLHSELNYAQSQQVQATQAMAGAQMQLAVLENNQRQFMFQDEQTGIEAACSNVAAAGGFVTIPACFH